MMVNTNKIISYLTRKRPLPEKASWGRPELSQDILHRHSAGAGLEKQEIEPLNDAIESLQDVRPGSLRKVAELDLSPPSSENFMLGASVTSFYIASSH